MKTKIKMYAIEKMATGESGASFLIDMLLKNGVKGEDISTFIEGLKNKYPSGIGIDEISATLSERMHNSSITGPSSLNTKSIFSGLSKFKRPAAVAGAGLIAGLGTYIGTRNKRKTMPEKITQFYNRYFS